MAAYLNMAVNIKTGCDLSHESSITLNNRLYSDLYTDILNIDFILILKKYYLSGNDVDSNPGPIIENKSCLSIVHQIYAA